MSLGRSPAIKYSRVTAIGTTTTTTAATHYCSAELKIVSMGSENT